MERFKFKTTKKLKKIHRQMILNFGTENIRYEYEHYYFNIKTENVKNLQSHFNKIGLELLKV